MSNIFPSAAQLLIPLSEIITFPRGQKINLNSPPKTHGCVVFCCRRRNRLSAINQFNKLTNSGLMTRLSACWIKSNLLPLLRQSVRERCVFVIWSGALKIYIRCCATWKRESVGDECSVLFCFAVLSCWCSHYLPSFSALQGACRAQPFSSF